MLAKTARNTDSGLSSMASSFSDPGDLPDKWLDKKRRRDLR